MEKDKVTEILQAVLLIYDKMPESELKEVYKWNPGVLTIARYIANFLETYEKKPISEPVEPSKPKTEFEEEALKTLDKLNISNKSELRRGPF